jgi:large subunit ribosomal protein L4
LRRDLIHRLYHWRSMLNKYRTHLTRNITRTAGSARKPHPQKGGGRARIGKINAPGRHGGGKAHGAKPKVYSFHLNEKIKLSALRALLSSRLF